MNSTRNALVVDDDPKVTTVVTRWLQDEEYSVETAHSFVDARRKLSISFDVLVVGISLKEYNGLHLALLARAAHPSIRIVTFYSWDDPVIRTQAEKCNAVFLTKPLVASLLCGVCREPRQPT
jgi:DNA-binding response OmpR family regulator